jgi:hypothetical protein
MNVKFEVFMAVKIHAEVFWVVTPCSIVARPSVNIGILLQHYMVSQPRRPQLERYECLKTKTSV